jgi:hypothetical protein
LSKISSELGFPRLEPEVLGTMNYVLYRGGYATVMGP